MSIPAVDIGLTLDVQEPLAVVSCRVIEGISELTHAELEIASHDDPDFERVLTGDAVVHVLFDGVEQRRFTLKVGRIVFLGIEMGSFRYKVDLHAHLWLLRFTDNTRKYRNMSAKDIVTQILDECGVVHEWRLTRQPPVRKYCAQYHETNLDFVSRLLEFEGIYYTFADDGTLILADQSSASPPVEGPSHFDLLDNAGALQRDERGIFEIGRGGSVGSGMVTLNDWNWKKPKKNLIQTASAAEDAELEVYDYPSGFRKESDGAYLAQIRLEALRATVDTLEGKSDVPFFAPAHTMTFGGRAGAMFAGEFLFTHVEHLMTRPGFGEKVLAYENSFRAIEREVPFRPPVQTPRPTIAGFHTAMVRGPVGEEIHTDKYGRFRAQFHWDREAKSTDEDSRWLRILQESSTAMVLARVGWEMSIGYIDGDPDRPIGLSRHINGEMVPNYNQPPNKSMMTIKTPTYPGKAGWNEWRLDDRAGSMSMDVRAERDMLTKVINDRLERVGNDVVHTCLAKFEHEVTRDQTVSVGANARSACDAGASLAVGGNRTMSVGGSETIVVGQEQTARTEGNEYEKVGGIRMTVSGNFQLTIPPASDLVKGMATNNLGSLGPMDWLKHTTFGQAGPPPAADAPLTPQMPPAPATAEAASGMAAGGSIDRTTDIDMLRTAGGAHVAMATGNIDVLAGKTLAETIGGAKLTFARTGDIGQTVAGALTVTVKSNVVRSAGQDMSYTANKTLVKVGADAQLTSAERVELRGDVIEIEAESELKLCSGSTEITLQPESTAMKGRIKLDSSGGKIVVTGGPENLTS
ncbi:MAG: type VI secretion system tip protein TssI/VgrG [Minicystis sp.]